MSEKPPQIVITGIGIVSPLGIGCEAFIRACQVGQSVVQQPTEEGDESLPVAAMSRIADFNPNDFITPRKGIKLMCREVQMGVAAGQLAVDHAQLPIDQVDSDRFGVVLGSEMLYGTATELSAIYREAVHAGRFELHDFGANISKLFPLWMLKYLPNMPACHLAIAQNACGPNNSVVQGDASSLLAIAEAFTVIERGWADVMIVGGTGGMVQPVRNLNFDESMFSRRSENPAAASRPFDAKRDGMAASEGAATFVLETAEHAAQRGAKPLASVAGFGRTFGLAYDSHARLHNGASTQATSRAIRGALQSARCAVEDVDHVNAHGLSTIESDQREAAAIRMELGDVPVTALKSYYGNPGASGGAIEMAASVLALHGDMPVPPTLNYDTPDPMCPIQVIVGAGHVVQKPAAVILSQSSTGQTAALVLRAWND